MIGGFLLLVGKINGVSCQLAYGSGVEVWCKEPAKEPVEIKSYCEGLVFRMFVKIGTGKYSVSGVPYLYDERVGPSVLARIIESNGSARTGFRRSFME